MYIFVCTTLQVVNTYYDKLKNKSRWKLRLYFVQFFHELKAAKFLRTAACWAWAHNLIKWHERLPKCWNIRSEVTTLYLAKQLLNILNWTNRSKDGTKIVTKLQFPNNFLLRTEREYTGTRYNYDQLTAPAPRAAKVLTTFSAFSTK